MYELTFFVMVSDVSPVHLLMTPQHLMTLLKRVRNWWKGGEFDLGVVTLLGVPVSIEQEMQERFGSDGDTVVEKCIEWWLEHAANVSWRKILVSLDWAKETTVADSLRHCAEPLSGYNG